MKLSGKERTVKQTIGMCAVLVLSLLLAGVSPALGRQGTAAPLLLKTQQGVGHRADLEQVLSVVEHRTKDGRVVAKLREKLSAMSGRDLRLAVSLCDRIARNDDSAGADIAFSLVMALVVLS
jgi:hypothetical protein